MCRAELKGEEGESVKDDKGTAGTNGGVRRYIKEIHGSFEEVKNDNGRIP